MWSIGSSTALSGEAHDYATACQEAIEGTEPRLAPRLRPDGAISKGDGHLHGAVALPGVGGWTHRWRPDGGVKPWGSELDQLS